MKVAPLIRPIQLQGGTFFAFSSAAEDMLLAFANDSDRRFKFSKFALLNIPNIENQPVRNTIKLNAIPGAFRSVNFSRTSDWNNHLAESFQNYCLNLETLLTSKDSYNFANPTTVSERVFWKWMKEIAAFRGVISSKTAPNDPDNPARYEEEPNSPDYNRIVVYMGEIDFLNNTYNNTNSYTEAYIHIPDFVGTTPRPLFKVVEDENYRAGMVIKRPPTRYAQDDEFLAGRNYNDPHEAGLDTHAFYDNDSGLGTLQNRISSAIEQYRKIPGRGGDATDIETDYIVDAWWYRATTEVNSYMTEPDTLRDAANDDLAIFSSRGNPNGVNRNQSAIRFRRSRLDGIMLDWDLDSYRDINADAFSFQDLNSSSSSRDFEFNAVLIYYDLFRQTPQVIENQVESDDFTPDSIDPLNPDYEILATNAFGIMFLDNVENELSQGGGYIPRLSKCRPNTITKVNGNAYGLKLQLKLNTSPYNSGIEVETIISDSNLLSMDIYADAMRVHRQVNEDISEFLGRNLDIDSRTRAMEQHLNSQDITNLQLLHQRIQAIEQILSSDPEKLNLVRNVSGIADLVRKNNEYLQMLLRGEIPSALAFDMDFFFENGGGLILDKSRGNKLGLGIAGRSYNIGEKYQVSIASDFSNASSSYVYEHPLQSETNYLRVQETSRFIPRKDIVLQLNDINVPWKKGQVMRVVFSDEYKMENEYGNFDLYIYTDKSNRTFGPEAYSVLIGKVRASDFTSRKGRPTLEIICVDEKKLTFVLDIIN